MCVGVCVCGCVCISGLLCGVMKMSENQLAWLGPEHLPSLALSTTWSLLPVSPGTSHSPVRMGVGMERAVGTEQAGSQSFLEGLFFRKRGTLGLRMKLFEKHRS